MWPEYATDATSGGGGTTVNLFDLGLIKRERLPIERRPRCVAPRWNVSGSRQAGGALPNVCGRTGRQHSAGAARLARGKRLNFAVGSGNRHHRQLDEITVKVFDRVIGKREALVERAESDLFCALGPDGCP